MKPGVRRETAASEVYTTERCHILETLGASEDPDLSIARARVEPGVATTRHVLEVDERYVITAGQGLVALGNASPEPVGPGDIVVIPRGTPQRITNTGSGDLVFYCLCTPAFTPECYQDLES